MLSTLKYYLGWSSHDSTLKLNPDKFSIVESTPGQTSIESTPKQTSIESTPKQTLIESTPKQTLIESTPKQTLIGSKSSLFPEGSNPYVHGTNSGIFDMLAHTDFCLMEPIDMIQEYGYAPITGEITGGGFDSVWCQCHPCFGRIVGKDYNSYGLSRVMDYTRISKEKDPISSLEYQVSVGSQCAYSNINSILIYMVRCQELGYNISKIVTSEVIADIKATRNAFATLLFLGSWFRPLPNLNDDVYDAIYTHCTIKNIKDKVKNYPDLHYLYKEHKEKQLPSEVLDMMNNVLSLPKKSIIKSGFACKDKEVELEITQPFTTTAPEYDSHRSALEPGYTIYRLTQDVSSYRINDALEKYARHELSTFFWSEFHERLCNYLDKFEHRINLLELMLNRINIPKISVSKNPYPLIMICENDTLMDQNRHEYRANRPLKLGTDITMIATDTIANGSRLVQYLSTHKIPCKVALFSDLK
ncbi:Hypothetical protein HVR_LOCUS227 [uncultured virus]|nr:Hypothetical protein HVR_LOCUS227 [uncultured virus]